MHWRSADSIGIRSRRSVRAPEALEPALVMVRASREAGTARPAIPNRSIPGKSIRTPPRSDAALPQHPAIESALVRTAGLQPRAVLEDHDVVPAEPRLQLLHAVEIDDRRPMDSREA